LHLGHQTLFSKLSENGGILIVDKGREKYLLPPEFRNRYTKKPLFFYEFGGISHLSGQEFIEKLTIDFPNLKKIVVGYDFRFGENRTSSADDLHKFFDGTILIIDEVIVDGTSVHSKEIARLIESGKIKKANNLLGRRYSIFAEHFRDRGLGTQELFPTLNLQNNSFLLPKQGVYATQTRIDDKIFESISFIGHRVTTDGNFSFETYVLDENLEDRIFGEVEIQFEEFIRENIKFEKLSDLKKQISRDIELRKTKET
jgi:riboflavin kinase/FMN adenylyltransferase